MRSLRRATSSPEVSPFRRIEAAMIISKSKTKEAVTQCNVSGEFYDALDAKVNELIKKAEQRAIANGRKTVRPQDL
jgi:histone H3/H4